MGEREVGTAIEVAIEIGTKIGTGTGIATAMIIAIVTGVGRKGCCCDLMVEMPLAHVSIPCTVEDRGGPETHTFQLLGVRVLTT